MLRGHKGVRNAKKAFVRKRLYFDLQPLEIDTRLQVS
jgi:hypothetical protein